MKAGYLFVSLLAATPLSIPAADAAVLLTFGQTSSGDTVTATQSATTTTITSDTTVEIDEIDAMVVIPISAILTFTATNTGPAQLIGAFDIRQPYSGSFTITNGPTNYLSGTFSDAIFGSGSGLVLSASEPQETVTFTSNVIAPELISGFDRSVGLSFTDVTPPTRIVDTTLGSFKSDISGDFSATAPEPSTWAMVLLGFAGLGFAGYCQARASRAKLAV